MIDTLSNWFSSLNNTEIIALIGTPLVVAVLGAIGWLINRKFDKKDPPTVNNDQSPKIEQKGLINTIGKITNIFKK